MKVQFFEKDAQSFATPKAYTYEIKSLKICAGQGYCWLLQIYAGKTETRQKRSCINS